MNKTQFFSAELVTSILLFISLVLLIISVWEDKRNEVESNLLLYSLESNSANIAEMLVTSPGKPLNWTVSYVEQLGLADNYNVLNSKKIENLFYMSLNNYSLVKELLGIPDYDYYLVLEYLNNSIMQSFGNTTLKKIVTYQENVVLNGVIMRFKVGVAD